ncbi:hypothetical protein ACFPDQ_07300 [Pseudofrancisella aestuarii]|uniref:Uncharacterized protein n=1 Tax=Pseudofrancisella aestuarii TaxID=2670347 RepID=A0ABV9TDS4_9GAMM|nr:hypothetical protein [Pseudofrancisella aestuarii]
MQIINELNGFWIGPWGNRQNVKMFIEVTGDCLNGYYLLDGEKHAFTGHIIINKDHTKIVFALPMSHDSGGVYNHKSKELELFCGDRRYIYKKANKYLKG